MHTMNNKLDPAEPEIIFKICLETFPTKIKFGTFDDEHATTLYKTTSIKQLY